MSDSFRFVAGWKGWEPARPSDERYVFVSDRVALVVDFRDRVSVVVSEREPASHPFGRWMRDPRYAPARLDVSIRRLDEVLATAQRLVSLATTELVV